MSPTVQAALDTGRAFRRLRPVSAAFLALLATACAGGVDIDRLAADRTITTGSVETAYYVGRPADGVASDEETIRNALGSADLAQIGESGLAWANPVTGSHGSITDIAERQERGLLCRSFTATRASYDGVGLYRGESCLGPAGIWSMRRFEAV